MFAHFKQIAIVLISLGFLAGCTSTTEEPEQGVQVRFTADAASRSSLSTSSNLAEHPFVVYGDMEPTVQDPANPVALEKIFEATPVRYTDGVWAYNDVKYFMPGNTYSFVALHPVKADATSVDNLSILSYENNRLNFTYTLPSKDDPTKYYNAEDLLIATHRRVYENSDNPHAVAFRFGHILSRLNFTVRVDPSADDPVTIHSLVLRNIGLEGSYHVKPASTDSETDDFEGNWFTETPNDDPSAPDVLFSISGAGNDCLPAIDLTITPGLSRPLFRPYDITAATAADHRAHPANPLFVIPQEVSTNAEMEVVYSVGTSDPITATASLYGISVASHGGIWEAGKSYSYTFTLGADEFIIYTQPTVDEWNYDEGNNYVIID